VKSKDYRDTLYVEELIGKEHRQHRAARHAGRVPRPRRGARQPRRECRGCQEGAGRLASDRHLARRDHDDLVEDGVKLFADAADKLYGAVAHKRATSLGNGIGSQKLALGDGITKKVATSTEDWRASAKIRRLWHKDKSVWTGSDEDKWLGWLNSAFAEKAKLADYNDFAKWVKAQGFTDAVVLGMGGSSLGPEVLAQTFAKVGGLPETACAGFHRSRAGRGMGSAVKIASTLFIVSSKSGGTTEPNVMKNYFFDEVTKAVGADKAGSHFVAVTDPGSSLEKVAKTQKFARIFHGDPTIGGRYSVLSPFGLVPARCTGVDLAKLLDLTLSMVRSCGPDVPPAENPGVQLGLAMGNAGLDGRDKVTILSSKKIADFGAWAEQLIAESTGKDGKGLIPIDGETLGEPGLWHRSLLYRSAHIEAKTTRDMTTSSRAGKGRPSRGAHRDAVDRSSRPGILPLRNRDRRRGIDSGHQPVQPADVEAAKIKTRELTEAFEKTGSLPPETPVVSSKDADLYTDDSNAELLKKAGANGDLTSWLKAHFRRVTPGDYVGAARLCRTRRRAYRHAAAHADGGARQEEGGNLRRIRPALPAFHRPGLQRRPEPACSCRSRRTMPRISPSRITAPRSVSSRRHRRVVTLAC
jgi:transaldolase/glucose-6-phosphate isomerase